MRLNFSPGYKSGCCMCSQDTSWSSWNMPGGSIASMYLVVMFKYDDTSVEQSVMLLLLHFYETRNLSNRASLCLLFPCVSQCLCKAFPAVFLIHSHGNASCFWKAQVLSFGPWHLTESKHLQCASPCPFVLWITQNFYGRSQEAGCFWPHCIRFVALSGGSRKWR